MEWEIPEMTFVVFTILGKDGSLTCHRRPTGGEMQKLFLGLPWATIISIIFMDKRKIFYIAQ